MKSIKILAINTFDFGSTGSIMLDIAKECRNKGYIYYTLSGSKKSNKTDKHFYIGSRLSQHIHYRLNQITGYHGLFSLVATLKIITIIKDFQPDIIHLHNVHGYYVNFKILFRYLKKIQKPVVWTLHDCWSFTGQCTHFDYIQCDKWRTLCNNCPLYKEYPQSLFFDRSSRMYCLKKELFTNIKDLTLVCPSDWLKKKVEESFFKTYCIKVIHNGIDLKVFDKRSTLDKGIKGKKIILGVSFSWNTKKGLDDFLKLDKIIDHNKYQIMLVGVNCKQNRQIGISNPKIKCIEKIKNKNDLAIYYNMADVFVNLTLEEVLGLVNLEALACGTPVITYKSGGSVECIDSSCGISVEKGNIIEVKRAIEKICEKSKGYYYIPCRERAKTFDKKIQCSKYLNLYNNTMKRIVNK